MLSNATECKKGMYLNPPSLEIFHSHICKYMKKQISCHSFQNSSTVITLIKVTVTLMMIALKDINVAKIIVEKYLKRI